MPGAVWGLKKGTEDEVGEVSRARSCGVLETEINSQGKGSSRKYFSNGEVCCFSCFLKIKNVSGEDSKSGIQEAVLKLFIENGKQAMMMRAWMHAYSVWCEGYRIPNPNRIFHTKFLMASLCHAWKSSLPSTFLYWTPLYFQVWACAIFTMTLKVGWYKPHHTDRRTEAQGNPESCFNQPRPQVVRSKTRIETQLC